MFLFFLFYFNKKILNSHLIIKTTVKKNVSFIIIKILIDFKMITNFIFQLLIKKLRNPEGESNEHQVLTLDEQRLRTFQLHDFEINMTNSDDKNVTIKMKLLDSNIIKFDLILKMFGLKKNNSIINGKQKQGCGQDSTHGIKINKKQIISDPLTSKFKRRDSEGALQKKLADAFTIKFLNIKKFKQFVKQNDNEVYMIMFAIIINKSSINDHQKIEVFLNNNDNINQIFFKYFDFQDVFFKIKTNILSKHDSNDLVINTQDKESLFNKIYNLSQLELKVLKKYIIKQLNKEFIVPSKSPADAPVLFVLKKDGNFRLYIDYKKLNVIIIKNQHFLSLIQKTMNRLIEAKKFIKLNIQHVYNMIRIKKNNEGKTAFRIKYKHFKYKIISFELINAFVIFQHYSNKAFADYLDIFVFVYLNDIFIYSVNDEKYTKYVRIILLKLRQYNLYCKISKCHFGII